MRNKIFTKIIITTLLVTFLTFNVGRVTRVSAVGTVATVAGTALLATGVIYMSYLALTGAQMRIPVANDIELWLKDIGTKVVQYPSGSATYKEMYEYYSIHDPISNVIDGVWSWTEDKLKSFANDFADTRIIDNIVSYESSISTYWQAANGYEYDLTVIPDYISGNSDTDTFEYYESIGFSFAAVTGPKYVVAMSDGTVSFSNLVNDLEVRNYLTSDNTYMAQYYNGSAWVDLGNYTGSSYTITRDSNTYFLNVFAARPYWYVMATSPVSYTVTSSIEYAYPFFPDELIYDSVNDEYLPLVEVSDTQNNLPSWIDPDNDNRPVIPWVPIPDLPTSIDVPSGYTGLDQWGFNLEDLLDNLSELGESIFDLAVLKELINSFAGLHGDDYYLYYDNGDTNYFTYYQPTIYEGDYITYNYDISEHEDVMPVNLNEIQLYTDNRYLEQIKESAVAGSSMLRDLAVFWHDVDPEITYIVLGCCILVLIGAFTGKLGHS